jgi:hypothetical protein
MRVTLEIDDALLPSVEQYLSTQVQAVNDEVTKAQRLVRNFESPEHWIQMQVGQLLHQVLMQYPTDDVRAHLKASNELQDKIKDMARPKQVKG